MIAALGERKYFLSVGPEDIVLGATEIGVNLAWQDGIFAYICLARVLVQWQDEKPGYANDGAES